MVSSSNQRGLKVMELEKEWKTYPVLHFDMSIMRNFTNMDGYREALSDVLARYEKQYGTTKEADRKKDPEEKRINQSKKNA